MSNDEVGAFFVGILLTILIVGVFLASCDDLHNIENIKNYGVVHEQKAYRLVIDSTRTDSLHNWRKW